MKIYLVWKNEIDENRAICCFTKKEEAEKFIQELKTGERFIYPDNDEDDEYILLPNGEKYESYWIYRTDSFCIKELELI